MQKEVLRLDRYQAQFAYLMKNRIETPAQLAMQYDAVQAEIDALTDTALAASSTEEGALGEANIFNGDYEMNYLAMNGSPRTQKYTYFPFVSRDGTAKEIPAYCINPTTKGIPQTVGAGEFIKYIANEAGNDPKCPSRQ